MSDRLLHCRSHGLRGECVLTGHSVVHKPTTTRYRAQANRYNDDNILYYILYYSGSLVNDQRTTTINASHTLRHSKSCICMS